MRKLLFLFLLFFSLKTSAQNVENTKPVTNEPKVEMADTFRENGKIYIVVTVVMIVLLGIFAYLFMLEKKLAKVEKELKKNAIEKS
jgi:CcmD family protein